MSALAPRQAHIALLDIIVPPPARRARTALEHEGIAQLAESIKRLGLLHPVALHDRGTGQYTLIAGARRVQACRVLLWREIEAKVYPPDMPEREARIIEIAENLYRAELTPGERHAHAVQLLALIREEEEAAGESLERPDFTAGGGESLERPDFTPTPTTGRGHRGAISKVAKRLGKDQSTVRHHLARAGETIGETIDPSAPAATLRDQADRAHEAARDVPRRRPSTPKPKSQPASDFALTPTEPPPARPDLATALRELDQVVLPTNFAAHGWASSFPAAERKEMQHLARALGHRLLWLERVLAGEEPVEAPSAAEGDDDDNPALLRIKPGLSVQLQDQSRLSPEEDEPVEAPSAAEGDGVADHPGESDVASPGEPGDEQEGNDEEEDLGDLDEEEEALDEDLGDQGQEPATVEQLQAFVKHVRDVLGVPQNEIAARTTARGPDKLYPARLSGFVKHGKPLSQQVRDQLEATLHEIVEEGQP